MKYIVVLFLSLFHFSCLGQIDSFLKKKFVNNNYVGGFLNGDISAKPAYKSNFSKRGSVVVSTADELIKSLRNSTQGSVIYIDDNASIDLSKYKNISINNGLTLVSGRGIDGKNGALLYTNNLNTSPLFNLLGSQITIMGIRLKGPDGLKVNREGINRALKSQEKKGIKKDNSRIKTYGIPNSVGIMLSSGSASIINCEISGWSHAAIRVSQYANAKISYNYIYKNQRAGLGYGVLVEGDAQIVANIFNENRHAIASSGVKNSSYLAEYNVCLELSSDQGHVFDVHGGRDRKDGTNSAGKSFVVRRNIFFYNGYPLFKIRGRSAQNTQVNENYIIDGRRTGAKPNSSKFFQQVNSVGRFVVENNEFIENWGR